MPHPSFELVADRPYCVEVLPGRVVQGPVFVPLAREDRAGFTAASPRAACTAAPHIDI
ncbi:MAG TPA: hypothetical protein VFI46_05420 [Jiangellaceae bacterium]|nr:hypothetical protein [Jiangellaceae bacterium]